MLDFQVDKVRCSRCDLCVRDCPSGIIQLDSRGIPFIAPELENRCIRCQHCLAVCPAGAISILRRNPENSLPIYRDKLPRLEQMELLMRARRSMRGYAAENVPWALIRRLLETLAHVPTGVNARELTFHVISDTRVMLRFREQALSGLKALAEADKLPPRFGYLREAVKAWYESGKDIIFRGAPHVLIVSAPPDAPCHREDVILALAYFELLANSAGLGTLWCGMLKMTLEVLPELKGVIGLPRNHSYYPMLFGKPCVHYLRTVQREDGAAIREIAL